MVSDGVVIAHSHEPGRCTSFPLVHHYWYCILTVKMFEEYMTVSKSTNRYQSGILITLQDKDLGRNAGPLCWLLHHSWWKAPHQSTETGQCHCERCQRHVQVRKIAPDKIKNAQAQANARDDAHHESAFQIVQECLICQLAVMLVHGFAQTVHDGHGNSSGGKEPKQARCQNIVLGVWHYSFLPQCDGGRNHG